MDDRDRAPKSKQTVVFGHGSFFFADAAIEMSVYVIQPVVRVVLWVVKAAAEFLV